MAIRTIVKVGDNVLRKLSKEQKAFDKQLHILLGDMKDTLRKANGRGLAAVQIGVLKKIAVIESNGIYLELINPVIEEFEGSVYLEEGCLSIPGESYYVERPEKLTVSAFDRFGNPFRITVNGFMARVFCHEIDHMFGILYTDKSVDKLPKEAKIGRRDD